MRERRPPEGAKRRPRLASPHVSALANAVIAVASPAYQRFALKLRGVEFRHPERLLSALDAFDSGSLRLILAFRHPYGDEPQVLARAFLKYLPREARRLGLPPPRSRRLLFVHGYEVPMWSGAFNRWILPRTGAMPVYHAKLDTESIAVIRRALVSGPYPLALAPEGQASYHSQAEPRIEGGVARFARWGSEDLARGGNSARIAVIPLSVHYRFDRDGKKLASFVSGLEALVGIPASGGGSGSGSALPERLSGLYDRLLALAEEYYGNGLFPSAPGSRGSGFAERRDALVEAALLRAEGIFGLPSAGDAIKRLYRIRQEGWDRIFPPDGLPRRRSLARALADRRAGEAWFAMRHMEYVDLLFYVDHRYWEGDASFDRLVESAYSMGDLASRLTGGTIADRPNILAKRAVIIVGEPVEDAAPGTGAAPSLDALPPPSDRTEALRLAFSNCLKEYLDEER